MRAGIATLKIGTERSGTVTGNAQCNGSIWWAGLYLRVN